MLSGHSTVPSFTLQVEAYDNDELNHHGGLRVSFGMQLMGAVARIEREVPAITWPFLLLHGDDDKLCDIRGSQMMFDMAQSTDKKIKVGPAPETYSTSQKCGHTDSFKGFSLFFYIVE